MSTDTLAELGPMLAPLPGEDTCGPSMRYDRVFTEIRLAREEDDPTLPMGQWERPLKKADWPLIIDRCSAILTKSSKDLQVAAWLLEAWTRRDGWVGLERGLCLVKELAAQHWDGVHPRIDEDGDSDARVAPLQWLNESMPLTIKVHVPLIHLGLRKPPRVMFSDWERLTASELAGQVPQSNDGSPDDEPPVTRTEVLALAQTDQSGTHVRTLQLVRESLEHVKALLAHLDERMGLDAPNLHKLRGTLEVVERVVVQFQPLPKKALPAAAPEEPLMNDAAAPAEGLAQEEGGPAPIPFIPRDSAAIRGAVRNREEAYAQLEALAEFLEKTEPHSPTPYLIRRAVNWGRMPLPQLMEEIMREEGDLNRMANLLGLHTNR